MPESTAREWARRHRIKVAAVTATGRYRVGTAQLNDVRAMLGLPRKPEDEPASEPETASEPAPETEAK